MADDERLAVRLLDILGDEAGLAGKKMFGSPMKGPDRGGRGMCADDDCLRRRMSRRAA